MPLLRQLVRHDRFGLINGVWGINWFNSFFLFPFNLWSKRQRIPHKYLLFGIQSCAIERRQVIAAGTSTSWPTISVVRKAFTVKLETPGLPAIARFVFCLLTLLCFFLDELLNRLFFNWLVWQAILFLAGIFDLLQNFLRLDRLVQCWCMLPLLWEDTWH